jgi:hypothetical protein
MQEGAHKKLLFRSNICHGDRGVTVTGVTRGSDAQPSKDDVLQSLVWGIFAPTEI